ncbi:MAG: plastocyanin/azurin family copper-binding protein [Planctomycetaceae bacterium]
MPSEPDSRSNFGSRTRITCLHNFAIIAPGTLEEIGELAEETGRDPDAKDRHYVPRSDKVLLASRLLEPGQSQALTFQAPAEPGVYPYVCTYPGHWRRMHGALYIVEDLRTRLKSGVEVI